MFATLQENLHSLKKEQREGKEEMNKRLESLEGNLRSLNEQRVGKEELNERLEEQMQIFIEFTKKQKKI